MQDVEVHLHRILAQLLHITETVEIAVDTVAVNGIKARWHLFDLQQTDGLIEHTCPTGLKGPGHHLIVGTHCRRSQKERILTMDATEIDGQTGIVGGDIVGMDAS